MANRKNKIKEYTLVMGKNNHPILEEVSCRDWYGDTYFNSEIARMMRELFNMNRLAMERNYVVAFDSKRQVKGVFLAGQGSITNCPIPTGSLFTFLLLVGAISFMEIHNHVDGSLLVSDGDSRAAQGMQSGANLFNMFYNGSMIIGGNNFYVYGIEEKDVVTESGDSLEKLKREIEKLNKIKAEMNNGRYSQNRNK